MEVRRTGALGQAPQERLSRLTAAIRRIVASPDVGTVLREVVDSARTLSGARCGLIPSRFKSPAGRLSRARISRS